MRNMIAAILLLVAPVLANAAPEFQAGVHYRAVAPEQPGAEGNKIQILEFFWYGCSHCFSFEPHLKKWEEKKPEDVEFVRVPAMFNRPDVIMHAKTFYALNQIGAKDEIHDEIFHALNVKKARLRSEQEMEEFLQGKGINIEEYRKAMKSFAVQTNIRKAAILAENYDIRGVPAVAVDGKYKIGGLEGGAMIDIMSHLVGEARKGKAVTK